jgi:hypothetical protein
MNNFFLVKVKYDKMMDNGVQKTVTEPYLVDALSFTEAEARIIEEMKPYISGEFMVSAISRYKVAETLLNESGDRYYRAKLEYITLDEKSGNEKKQGVFFLIQASTIEEARNVIVAEMKKTMIDYDIVKIEETKIMDVFLYR